MYSVKFKSYDKKYIICKTNYKTTIHILLKILWCMHLLIYYKIEMTIHDTQ